MTLYQLQRSNGTAILRYFFFFVVIQSNKNGSSLKVVYHGKFKAFFLDFFKILRIIQQSMHQNVLFVEKYVYLAIQFYATRTTFKIYRCNCGELFVISDCI